MTRTRKVICIILALIAIAAAGVVWQIGPRNILGLLLYDQRREGDLKAGDMAPDVSLTTIEGEKKQLFDFVGPRPLVVIFGSFT